MSAKAREIPYQLRPNKYIDRQLFLDVLSRTIPLAGLEQYCYISMGGKHLSDHHAVYRRLGIEALCSFDLDENIVARQEENKPKSSTLCRHMNADEIPEKIDNILDETCKRNAVVWLDYTDKSRRAQLQNFKRLLTQLQNGDIVKITMNAAGEPTQDFRDKNFKNPNEYLHHILHGQLMEFFPPGVVSIKENEVPDILFACIRTAVNQAQLEDREMKFVPILLTEYSDGIKMITSTVLVTTQEEWDQKHNVLAEWRYWSKEDWSNVEKIHAPDLSQREKLQLDKEIDLQPKEIQELLNCNLGDTEDKSISAITSYCRYHRYYPSFHNVEF